MMDSWMGPASFRDDRGSASLPRWTNSRSHWLFAALVGPRIDSVGQPARALGSCFQRLAA